MQAQLADAPTQPQPIPDREYRSEETGRKGKFSRLTAAEVAKVIRLSDEGLSCNAIALALKRTHHTISAVLDRLEPTTDAAKRRLDAGAYELADRVVRKSKPAEGIDVLERLGVLRPKQSGGSQGVQVIVGVAALPGLPSGQAEQAKPAPVLVQQSETLAVLPANTGEAKLT